MKSWLRSGLVGGVTGGLRAEGLGWGLRVERECVKEKRLKKKRKKALLPEKRLKKIRAPRHPSGGAFAGPSGGRPGRGLEKHRVGAF